VGAALDGLSVGDEAESSDPGAVGGGSVPEGLGGGGEVDTPVVEVGGRAVTPGASTRVEAEVPAIEEVSTRFGAEESPSRVEPADPGVLEEVLVEGEMASGGSVGTEIEVPVIEDVATGFGGDEPSLAMVFIAELSEVEVLTSVEPCDNGVMFESDVSEMVGVLDRPGVDITA